ncbi:MAG: WS/DGAT domain-containing protein [Acidobacteriota bacterium]
MNATPTTTTASDSAASTVANASPRHRVTGNDGIWLQDTATNLMVINAIYVLDAIDIETLRQVWDERVMQAGEGETYPRFRMRLHQDGSRWFWQKDEEFELNRHIVYCPEKLRSKQDLQEYVGRIASQPLEDDRPRWRMELIENYAEGQSAAVFRIHHGMADGIALIPVMFSIMDTTPPDGGEAQPSGPHPADLAAKRAPSALVKSAAAAAAPFVLARKAIWGTRTNPLHGGGLGGTKRVAWSNPLPLDEIKALCKSYGATINDVLVACVAGAFHRYVKDHADSGLGALRASVPVNMRSADQPFKMENHFATVLLDLPVGHDTVRERVLATKRRMDKLKRSVEPLVMFGTSNVLLRILPDAVSRVLVDFFGNKTTLVLTNVPGPRENLYLAGRQVHSMMFWVPQRASIGIGVSILSFSGAVRVGVIADTEVVSDPEDLIQAYEKELEELKVVAGG